MEGTNKYATLHFNLEDPYAKIDLEAAIKAPALISAISEIDNEVFRKRIKYGYEEYTEKEIELLEKLRKEVWDIVLEAVPNYHELSY